MDLGRNHTCFCTKTLVMTPAVLHTSFWPHGADLHKLYRSESHIYAQWLWHAQERWEWWWSRKVSAQSDEQVLSLWATKRHTCWKLSYKGLILLPKAGSELEPLQQITLLHVMTLLKAGSHTETQHQPASSTGCYMYNNLYYSSSSLFSYLATTSVFGPPLFTFHKREKTDCVCMLMDNQLSLITGVASQGQFRSLSPNCTLSRTSGHTSSSSCHSQFWLLTALHSTAASLKLRPRILCAPHIISYVWSNPKPSS